MARRIGIGFVWFLIFYFGGCLTIYAIRAKPVQPSDRRYSSFAEGFADGYARGAQRGAESTEGLKAYVATAALLAAFFGMSTGVLPGGGSAERRDPRYSRFD